MTADIRWAARSVTGLVRTGNEDSGYAGHQLYAVADGMGGHAAGEVASATVIAHLISRDSPARPGQLVQILGTAIREANDAIRHRTEEDPATRTMGTTLTAMLWSGRAFALAHIGDSRAYRLRNGQLHQLTEDHSLHNLVAAAGRSPLAPIMARYLDGRPDRSPDLALHQAARGDRYLLCSDGLTSAVTDHAIRETVASTQSLPRIADELTRLADDAGGPDNTTVIIIECQHSPDQDSLLEPVTLGAACQ